MHLRIQKVALDQIVDLRHRMLRQGLPREAAIFDGDRGAGALHYGAIDAGAVIGCATLHPSRWEDRPAWQLRGMAVADSHQGGGVGRELIQFIEADLAAHDVRQLWCNARVPAIGFYQKMGWRVVSDVFDIPTAGPHVRMTRTVNE